MPKWHYATVRKIFSERSEIGVVFGRIESSAMLQNLRILSPKRVISLVEEPSAFELGWPDVLGARGSWAKSVPRQATGAL